MLLIQMYMYWKLIKYTIIHQFYKSQVPVCSPAPGDIFSIFSVDLLILVIILTMHPISEFFVISTHVSKIAITCTVL